MHDVAAVGAAYHQRRKCMNDRFIREPECRATTGLSRTTRWRLERQQLFPKRRKISQNTVGWLESEILSWLRSKANGSDQEDAAK